MATEITEKRRFRLPTVVWGPLATEPPRIFAWTLSFESRVPGQHVCSWQYGSIVFQISKVTAWWGLKDACFV